MMSSKKSITKTAEFKPKTFQEVAGEKNFKIVQKVVKNAKKWGQTTKISQKLLETVLNYVCMGYPINLACVKAGTPYKTFNVWCQKDEDLRHALDASLQAAEGLWIDPILEAAASGDKDEARWLLTHQRSQSYSTQSKFNIDPHATNLSNPTDELIKFITGGSN